MTAFVALVKTLLNLAEADSKLDDILVACVAAAKLITIALVIGAKALEFINQFIAAAK